MEENNKSFKISLIETKIHQKSKQSFCQKCQKCFLHIFLKRKKTKAAKTENNENINTFFQTFDEKPQSEALENNFDTKKANSKNFFTKYKVESFPQNEIFLLQGNSTKKPILVKITEKFLEKKHKNLDLMLEPKGFASSFFSNASENDKIIKQIKKIPYSFPSNPDLIQFQIDYLTECDLPDRSFSEYIASKILGNLVLDFSGGIGEYTIAIAKKSDFVISCSNNLTLTDFCRKNTELYGINNIDFINFPAEDKEKNPKFKDFLTMKNRNNKADLGIVNPSTILKNFSSKKIYDPYLKKLLKFLSHNSKSFLLILPKHFQNFEGLADLMADGLKNGERCGIEIEKIFENKKLKHLLVNYGPISFIKGSEEMAFIQSMIEKNEENEDLYEAQKNHFKCLSNQISHNLGNMFLLGITMKVINEFSKEKNWNIYVYMLEAFKKYNFNFNCNQNLKELCNELGMMKSFSTDFEKLQRKSQRNKTSLLNFEELNANIHSKFSKKNENNDKTTQNKKYFCDSFYQEHISDSSKSIEKNSENEVEKNFTDGLKPLKRCESGVPNDFNKYDIEVYFNSLGEKNLI